MVIYIGSITTWRVHNSTLSAIRSGSSKQQEKNHFRSKVQKTIEDQDEFRKRIILLLFLAVKLLEARRGELHLFRF